MKKIIALIMCMVISVGFLVPSFAGPPENFYGIDKTFEYQDYLSGEYYKEVYISHKTLKKSIKSGGVSRAWASPIGAIVGKAAKLGWWLGVAVSAACALLATCDACIEEIDEGYGIIVKFIFVDSESGWCPVDSIVPQDEWGAPFATDWEGCEEWAYNMRRAGVDLNDLKATK